jgi:hypothetical protein
VIQMQWAIDGPMDRQCLHIGGYTCNMTAPDRERGLRLQKFHSIRGSGCKLARDLLLQICRDRAKKRMTRNRRWGCAARLYRENVPDLTMDVCQLDGKREKATRKSAQPMPDETS